MNYKVVIFILLLVMFIAIILVNAAVGGIKFSIFAVDGIQAVDGGVVRAIPK